MCELCGFHLPIFPVEHDDCSFVLFLNLRGVVYHLSDSCTLPRSRFSPYQTQFPRSHSLPACSISTLSIPFCLTIQSHRTTSQTMTSSSTGVSFHTFRRHNAILYGQSYTYLALHLSSPTIIAPLEFHVQAEFGFAALLGRLYTCCWTDLIILRTRSMGVV